MKRGRTRLLLHYPHITDIRRIIAKLLKIRGPQDKSVSRLPIKHIGCVRAFKPFLITLRHKNAILGDSGGHFIHQAQLKHGLRWGSPACNQITKGMDGRIR